MNLPDDALVNLGLGTYEAAVYLALIGRGGLSPTELSNRSKVPRQRIYDVLESLSAKGLCISRSTTPKTYFAVSPSLGFENLVQTKTAALQREKENLEKEVEGIIKKLTPIFEAGRGHNDPMSYIEVVSEPDRIAAKALELARGAQTSVKSCIRRPLILSQEQNWRFIKDPLERKVSYQALYESSSLEDEELREWMKTFQSWGQEIRIVPELPVKMNSFDEEAVLLSMQDPVGGPPSFTALSIKHKGTVAFMNMAFENLWSQAKPFDVSV